MCCLFGIVDYKHSLTPMQKSRMMSILARACEARGTDATGIAYNSSHRLKIYKRPLPARYMHFMLPKDTHVVMGHTRMTTQGSEKKNRNNHPFPGRAGNTAFALAHNGVLYNDVTLRKNRKLPPTSIQTDSYIAVQLIEKSGFIDMESLRDMAEQVRGSYAFSVLDDQDNLYLVKGDNPISLLHYPQKGLYLYASTEEILNNALSKMPVQLEKPVKIDLICGDILKISPNGVLTRGHFNCDHLLPKMVWSPYASFFDYGVAEGSVSYIDDLKAVAGSFGLTDEDVDILLKEGFTPEEVEEYLYSAWV